VRARLRMSEQICFAKEALQLAMAGDFRTSHHFLGDSPRRHAGAICHSLPVPLGSGRYPSPPRRSLICVGCPFAEDRRSRLEAEEFPPPAADTEPRCLVVPVARCQEIVHDEISNVIAQSLTGRKVEEKVHPGKDTTHRCFVGRSLEARERATYNLQDL
jgi:hypothetical protein